MITTIAVVFFISLLVGMPIAFGLGIGAFVSVLQSSFPIGMMIERMMNSVNSFPLLAIPLFMVAGKLMESAGIMTRIIAFSKVLVGHIRGGLAQVTTLTGMVLAGVSGTAVGDAAALGAVLIPPMEKEYGLDYGSAVVASAANIGPIIPPSAAMIVYAFMTGGDVSVAGLFLAGIFPGVVIGVGMMVMSYFIARKRGYPKDRKATLKEILVAFKNSFLILTMPLVVIGGIVGGVFTATEAAAIAVAYSLFLGVFVTRELTLKNISTAFVEGAVISSVVFLLIAFASSVTFLLTVEQLPTLLTSFITSLTTNPMVFMILIVLLLTLVGMVIESNAAYIMLVPILSPVAMSLGIDPLRFGMIFVMTLVIGHLTPPVGVVLFVTSSVGGLSFERMIKAILPYIALQYGVLFLCLFVPEIYMFIPRLFGY